MTNYEIDLLIKKVAQGDIAAMEKLYLGLHRSVYFYALRLSNDPNIAEDVMQDTFISIMSNCGSYVQKGKGSSWIYTIARNKVLDYQRKQKNNLFIDEIEDLINPTNPIDEFTDEVSVIELLSLLNKKERDIVMLRILSGFTLTQVARELELPKGSVFWTYNNAMKKLKKMQKGGIDYVSQDKEANKAASG